MNFFNKNFKIKSNLKVKINSFLENKEILSYRLSLKNNYRKKYFKHNIKFLAKSSIAKRKVIKKNSKNTQNLSFTFYNFTKNFL